MKITVEITEQEKQDAIEDYIRSASSIDSMYEVVEFYPAMGTVIFKTRDHDKLEEVQYENRN